MLFKEIGILLDSELFSISLRIDQLLVVSDSGPLTVSRGQTMNVRGGEGTNTRTDGQTIFVDLDTVGIVMGNRYGRRCNRE